MFKMLKVPDNLTPNVIDINPQACRPRATATELLQFHGKAS